ncbi:MAG: alpha-L-fucosidase [Eubacteriales bacterium]|nr:alpha-L-fucosidase [Eubacteriales bacterium]
MYRFERAAYEKRMQWFVQARFGMFIHWGLYAVPARGEWVRSNERMPEEKYMPFFREFDPSAADPKAWVQAAKEAGMGYVILTAKHHDGFCLFDSELTDFKSTNTPMGRDIVREFLEAGREAGLKVGLYYSLIDWHHPDFPHHGDRYHPMRSDPAASNEERDFERYLAYMHGQVKELCTRYGRLDVLWFDFSYNQLRGEAWRANELADMVRTLQPGILLNNRLEVSGEGFGSLAQGEPAPCHGDFVSPERMVPPEGLFDPQGRPLYWETCTTMNHSWGYCAGDTWYKPAPLLLKKLVECVSKGGNFLLNVGPDGNGRIPRQAMDTLKYLGQWMQINGESIRGCGPSGMEKPEWGRITRRENVLYLHIYENALGPLPLYGIPAEKIRAMRLLQDGREIPLSVSWVHSDYPDMAFADLGLDPVLPDGDDTVLKVLLEEA